MRSRLSMWLKLLFRRLSVWLHCSSHRPSVWCCRVFLLLGNRDLNKLRLAAELNDMETDPAKCATCWGRPLKNTPANPPIRLLV